MNAQELDEAKTRYQLDSIHTASADQLGLMLFEAALRASRECQQAIGRGDWTQTVKHGRLVQDIMANLADSVNDAHPHAAAMRGLYLYCWRQASEVQWRHTAEDLDGVNQVLENLIAGLRLRTERQREPVGAAAVSVNFAG